MTITIEKYRKIYSHIKDLRHYSMSTVCRDPLSFALTHMYPYHYMAPKTEKSKDEPCYSNNKIILIK